MKNQGFEKKNAMRKEAENREVRENKRDTIKKNDIFELIIEDMSEDGAGIGRRDGYIWFVKDAVIGDRIEAGAMKMKKNYGFARLVKILEPSPSRVEEKCPSARRCGGCQLQMLSYEEQLKFKERKVLNHLKRIGGLAEVPMEPILGMEHPWRYRNKAQFPFGRDKDGRIIAGFYAGRTHCIIESEDCFLGVEENKEILERIKAVMEANGITPYDEEAHTGVVRHALIRKGFTTGELMVCLVINKKKLPAAECFVEALKEIPGMTGISYNINMEKTNVIMGNEVVNLYGPGYITDYIGNVKYQISPLSFYQVNPVQTERLYGTALEYAGLEGEETVWDLYCGIGTISLFLAQKAKQVYGVEIVPQAIDDARRNAALNGMENVQFFVGKAEEVLPREYEKNQVYADVIVVDPPRKGCDSVCLDTIVKMVPKRVVYVSCDSSTLARDVKYLGERGYEVKRVRCCDMFPMSGHVETVCLLTQKGKGGYHVEIEIPIETDGSGDAFKEEKGTYPNIKNYIYEKYGVEVHTGYIAQVKRMCGMDMRDCYNKSKKDEPEIKICPPDKVEYIKDALRHFKMI